MLNWLTRYAFVKDELDVAPDGTLHESVLDVGCGPHGLSTVLPQAEFVGIDVEFPGPVAPRMFGLTVSPGPLPFEDWAFDTVVCLDVLEHLPPPTRVGFVDELARVAARRVLIACPSDEGAAIDAMLRDAYAHRGIPAPAWLNEHDEHGLPTAAEIAACCGAPAGFSARELTMTNGLLSTIVVLADMLPELAAQAAAEWDDARGEWLELFSAARFGPCYRKGYAIERRSPTTAIVGADAVPATAWRAIRCPACGEAATAPSCASCGHAPRRDASGAFDLAAAPRAGTPGHAPVRSSAALRLLLSPDWERPASWLPVVARYVAGAPSTGDAVLCVDAAAAELPLAAIHEMLALVCESISGGRDFADVLVLDQPYDRSDLTHVDDVLELAAALGLAPAARPAGAADVARAALRAKELHDAVLAIRDRTRFASAADPWSSREPLVSVRIPTWNKPELLCSRAIPSALNGLYRNVEVVVCSDGPAPETRAAVAAIADPRVRYLELPERPQYPEQPWSFWETAGIHAVNRALDGCRGAFIAPLDHDDAFTDDHIALLLGAASGSGADLVYGQALMQDAGGPWHVCGSEPLAHGQIAHGAALYSSRLAHMRMDADCWLLGEPGDWNMWRRITATGAAAAFVGRVVLAHFAERSSIDDGGTLVRMERTPEEIAADVRRTGLEWLLDIPVAEPSLV